MYQHFQNQHPNKVEPLENITCVADQLKGLDTKLAIKYYELAFETCQKYLKEHPKDEKYIAQLNSISAVLNDLC